MIELQTVTTKAKNPSTNEFQDVTWGGINVLSTSGTTNYNNLTNKPTINGVTVQGSLTTGDLLITAADVGALPSGTKYGADFALSIDSQTFVVTAQLKDQDGNNLGQAKTIDLPLETMVVGGSYDDTTQKVILTLKNGQTVEFSVADLIGGLQSEITLSNKLDADLVDDVSSENKFVTAAEKTAWNAKANASEVYTKSQTDLAIETAIGALDVSSVGGSGKYISEISETDGKISPIVETMDTVPTNGSTKAVTSGGVQAPLAEVIDAGAKNLFLNEGENVTEYGIQCIINSDGTISLDGINTDKKCTGSFNINIGYGQHMRLIEGKRYTLSVDGYRTSTTTLGVYVYTSGLTPESQWDSYSNQTVDWNTGWNNQKGFRLFIRQGTVVNNLTLKIMICTAADWAISQKFVPYALPNPVLTPALIEAVDEGAKNLLRFDETSTDNNNVRFTVNADGSITATQIAARTATAIFRMRYTDNLLSQDVRGKILSGCPSGGSDNTYKINIERRTSPYTNYGRDTGNGLLIPDTIADDIPLYLYIQIYSNATLPITFKPMICTKAAWDVSHAYEPYALTNPELTVENESQQSEINYAVNTGVKNLLSVNSGSGTNVTMLSQSGIIKSGNYVMTFKASNFSGNYALSFYDENGALISMGSLNGAITADKSVSFTLGQDAYTVKFFIYGTATISELMLRPASITDPTFQPYALSNPTLTPAVIKAVDEGAKNHLDLHAIEKTDSNVTFTINSDKTISITTNGAASAQVSTKLLGTAGSYVPNVYGGLLVSGVPNPDKGTALYVAYSNNGTSQAVATTLRDGETTIVDGTYPYIQIFLIVYSGSNIGSTPVIFKPMICTAADYAVSPKFVPYALSNPTLTPAAIKAVDEGAKNLLKITASSSSGNVNFTVNGDGTITVDGTAGTSNVVFVVANGLTIPAGNYYISMFDNSAYYSDKMYISAQFKNTPSGQSVWTGHEYYTDTQINPAGDIQAVAIVVKAGQKISQTVKPMICTAADWAISQKFVSYCPTMAEMYAMILALQNNS